MADEDTELEEQSEPTKPPSEAPPEPPPMQHQASETDFDERPSTQPHEDPVAAAETVSDGSVDTLDGEPTQAGPPPSEAMVDEAQTTVIVYRDGEAVDRQTLTGTAIRFGDREEPGSADMALSPWHDTDDTDGLWTEHGVIYAHGDGRTLVVTSDAHTQLNGELLELGASKGLQDGDRIIVADDIGLVVNF
jgi:hypothetical protein